MLTKLDKLISIMSDGQLNSDDEECLNFVNAINDCPDFDFDLAIDRFENDDTWFDRMCEVENNGTESEMITFWKSIGLKG